MTKPLVILFASLVATASVACASRGGDDARVESAGAESAIASIHQAKCGNCHRLVEPSTRTRPQIVQALGRHEKRVHLSTAQWTALTDYLAPDATKIQAKTTTADTTAR